MEILILQSKLSKNVFSIPRDCCNNFFEKKIIQGKCDINNITFCSPYYDDNENAGYVIQIFGIVFIVFLSTFFISIMCRSFINPEEIKDKDHYTRLN